MNERCAIILTRPVRYAYALDYRGREGIRSGTRKQASGRAAPAMNGDEDCATA